MNDTLGKIKLKENQLIACNNLHSGSILAGGVSSGKTYISIWASRNSKVNISMLLQKLLREIR